MPPRGMRSWRSRILASMIVATGPARSLVIRGSSYGHIGPRGLRSSSVQGGRCDWDTTGQTPPPASSFPEGSYDARPFFRHEIIHTSTKSGARVGRLHTPHGTVDTPGFVAVSVFERVLTSALSCSVGHRRSSHRPIGGYECCPQGG